TFGGGLTRYNSGRFKSYGVEQGLPGGIVNALAQDRRGDRWVGTDKGLALLKAGRFLKSIGQQQFPQENISALAVAPDGMPWVATPNAVLTIDNATGYISQIRTPFQDPTTLFFDHAG